jgi:hypothetical protein
MRKIFRRRLAATLVICTTALISSIASATEIEGLIVAMFADPSDFVVVLDGNAGSCGSKFFSIKRANDISRKWWLFS